MTDKKIPVILITGYLGSGKTTLMQNLLKQEQQVEEVTKAIRDIQSEAEIIPCHQQLSRYRQDTSRQGV